MSATSAPSRVAPEDRIPAGQKAAMSLGYTVDHLAAGVTTGLLWMPFFNIGLGMSPALLGLVLMILRGWDALTDPVMGNISDNTRTRWGRRRPYIALGAVLTAVCYLMLWRVPVGLAPSLQFSALVIVGIGFFTAFTIWSMPFYSLQMELTPSYDERTRLAAWTAIAGKLVYLGGGWILAFVTGKWFIDQATGKADIIVGMQATSWIVAALILILGLLPALFVRERYYAGTTSRQARTPFWASLRESCRCRPLWNLIGISFFLILGGAINNTLGQYVSIYLVNEGRLADAAILNGWKSTLVMIVGVAGIPFWTWLSEHLDKKIIVGLMLSASVTGHLLNLVCLRPDMPYLMLVPAVFETGAIGAVWLFLPSMKADVADHDEMVTGRRREGSLNAFYSWFAKVAITAGAGVGGLAVQLTGFDVAHGAAQPPEILERMRLLYLVLPLALWSITIIFIWKYPLGRTLMSELRSTLEARRGQI